MWIFFVVLAIIIVIVIWFISIYNRLVNLRNNVEASWQQIDVQLQKRYDLVPNLVETVNGSAATVTEVFPRVTAAGPNGIPAQGAGAQGEAENMLTGALKSLFAVAEAYPDLKANQNFLMLQQELANIENKVAYSRQHYNDVVRAYNTLQQQFPANMVAGMAGSRPADYFEIEEPAAREAPKVSFE